MTTDLRIELDDMAQLAENYADATVAVRGAKRRSRRGLTATSVAIAIVLIAAFGVSFHTLMNLSPAGALNLPKSMTLGPSETLPTDRAVGRGVLVLYSCSDCGPQLITQDGHRYAFGNGELYTSLAAAATGNDPARLSMAAGALSPDGRYLVAPVDSGGRIAQSMRDLTGTATRTIPLQGVIAWSPNGRYILGLVASGYARFDVKTSELAEFSLPTTLAGPHFPIGFVDRTLSINDAGYTEVWKADVPSGDRATITEAFPPGEVTVNAAALLRGDETTINRASQPNGAFGPGHDVALFAYTRANYDPTAILYGSNNHLTQRADLPKGVFAAFYIGDRLFVARTTAPPNDPTEFYAVRGGSVSLVSTLPAGVPFQVPGGCSEIDPR